MAKSNSLEEPLKSRAAPAHSQKATYIDIKPYSTHNVLPPAGTPYQPTSSYDSAFAAPSPDQPHHAPSSQSWFQKAMLHKAGKEENLSDEEDEELIFNGQWSGSKGGRTLKANHSSRVVDEGDLSAMEEDLGAGAVEQLNLGLRKRVHESNLQDERHIKRRRRLNRPLSPADEDDHPSSFAGQPPAPRKDFNSHCKPSPRLQQRSASRHEHDYIGDSHLGMGYSFMGSHPGPAAAGPQRPSAYSEVLVNVLILRSNKVFKFPFATQVPRDTSCLADLLTHIDLDDRLRKVRIAVKRGDKIFIVGRHPHAHQPSDISVNASVAPFFFFAPSQDACEIFVDEDGISSSSEDFEDLIKIHLARSAPTSSTVAGCTAVVERLNAEGVQHARSSSHHPVEHISDFQELPQVHRDQRQSASDIHAEDRDSSTTNLHGTKELDAQAHAATGESTIEDATILTNGAADAAISMTTSDQAEVYTDTGEALAAGPMLVTDPHAPQYIFEPSLAKDIGHLDEEEDSHATFLERVGDMSTLGHFTPELLRTYCCFFGKDRSQWHPQHKFLLFGCLEVFEYQAFDIFWGKLVIEGQSGYTYVDQFDEERWRAVGGCHGHHPGFGKTRIGIGSIVNSIVIRHLSDDIETHRNNKGNHKHLLEDAPDGVQCPSHQEIFAKYGCRCPCEPAFSGLLKAVREGCHLVVVPSIRLIPTWQYEFNQVNVEVLKQLTGVRLELVAAHSSASRYRLPQFATVKNKYVTKDNNIDDWYKANADLSYEAVEDSLFFDTDPPDNLQPPQERYKVASRGLIVITTPQSAKTQFLEKMKRVFRPDKPFNRPCDQDRFCRPGCKNTKNHNFRIFEEKRQGLAVCSVNLDEYHMYNHDTFTKEVLDPLSDQPFGDHPAVWPYDGTFFADGATDMLPALMSQLRQLPHSSAAEEDDLAEDQSQCSNEDLVAAADRQHSNGTDHDPATQVVVAKAGAAASKLDDSLDYLDSNVDWHGNANGTENPTDLPYRHKDFAGKAGRRLMAINAAMKSLRLSGSLPSAGKQWQELFDPNNTGVDGVRPEARSEARQKVSRLFSESCVTPMLRWARHFVIQLRPEDHYDGKPIVDLPEMKVSRKLLDTPHGYSPAVLEKLHKFSEINDRLAKLEVKFATRSKLSREEKKKREELHKERQYGWREVKTILCIPAFVTLGLNIRDFFVDAVKSEGWWIDPRSCPHYSQVPEMIKSSPFLQEIVNTVLKPDKDVQSLQAPNREDGEDVQIYHRKKSVIAIEEPALQFLVYLCLYYECRTKNIDTNSLGILHSGSDNHDIIGRFQLTKPGASIDTLVLAVKVGGVGISLTKANMMYAFDVDYSISRSTQVPCRMHRIGQHNKTEFIQLINTIGGVHAAKIKLRETGARPDKMMFRQAPPKAASGPAAQLTNPGTRESAIAELLDDEL